MAIKQGCKARRCIARGYQSALNYKNLILDRKFVMKQIEMLNYGQRASRTRNYDKKEVLED